MSAAVGAAALTAGAGVLSGLMSGFTGHYAAKKQLQAVRETNEANAALAKAQNDWNREQWQIEANWDSAAQQLQRWKDAGLNPNMFGGGTTAAPNIQSANLANQVAPDVQSGYMHIGDSLQRGFTDTVNSLAQIYQIRKLEQETTNLGSQNEQIKAMTKKLLSDVGLNEANAKLSAKQRDMLEKQMSGLDTQFSLWKAQTNAANASSRQINLHNRLMLETWDDQKLGIKLENDLKRSNLGLNAAQCKMLAQQFKSEVFNTALKANEFSMLDFTNWLTKVTGTAEAFKQMSDNEKSEVLGEVFASVRAILHSINGSYGEKREKLPRYGFREQLREDAQSFLNP